MTLFETGNLLVRRFTPADAESFFQLNSSEQVMRYIRPVKTREECDLFLAENIRLYEEQPGNGRWAVVDKSNGSVMGMFSILCMDADTGQLHIGYGFLPAYWGQGYATTLLKAGAAYFFEHNAGEILYAITRKENVASEKVLMKCGFTLSGLFKEAEHLWKCSL